MQNAGISRRPPEVTGRQSVHVLLERELFDRLCRCAKLTRRTRTATIELALEDYLDAVIPREDER